MPSKIGEMLDNIVVDLGTRISLAHYEAALAQISPINFSLQGKFMPAWKRHQNPLIPEMRHFTFVGLWAPGKKSNIKMMALNRGDMG